MSKADATHRCRICGAFWTLSPPDPTLPDGHIFREGSWSVQTPDLMKSCCDNETMGDQIEPLDPREWFLQQERLNDQRG